MTDQFNQRAAAAMAPVSRGVSDDVGILQAEVLALRFALGVIAQGFPFRGEPDPRKIAALALDEKQK